MTTMKTFLGMLAIFAVLAGVVAIVEWCEGWCERRWGNRTSERSK